MKGMEPDFACYRFEISARIGVLTSRRLLSPITESYKLRPHFGSKLDS